MKGKFANLKKDYLCFLAIIKAFFKDKNFLKHFGFIFALYFIGIFKFLTTDILHNDDTHRILDGKPLFDTTGRFLSEFLSHIFHMDYPYLNYISPLTQLFAIAFLSLASMSLVKIINKKITYFGLIASLCVGLSPFYLECLLYKYDSPYMALATLCTILPFLFIKRLSLFFITSVVFLLFMWNLYQANNGIYIVLSMFITLNLFLKNVNLKEIYKFIFISALAFIVSVLIYKFGFLPFRGEHSYIDATSIVSLEKINFTKVISFLRYSLNQNVIVWLFFISCILFFIKKILETKNKSYIFSLFFILAFLVIGFFASYGLYYIFPNLTFAPRFFLGFGGFAAILLVDLANFKIKFANLPFRLLILFFSYNLIVMSTIYMNTIISYKDYLNFRFSQIYSFLQNNKKYEDYEIQLGTLTSLGYTQTIANGVEYSPSVTYFMRLLSYWADLVNKNYNTSNNLLELQRLLDIKSEKIVCQNQALKETIDTKFNKFEIYEDCIHVIFKPGSPFIYNSKFSSYYIKLPFLPLIVDRKLEDDLTISLYNSVKMPYIGSLYFEFSKDISNLGDMLEIQIHLKEKKRFLSKSINTKDFNKYDKKYYYAIGLGNTTPNMIEKFVINIDDKIKYDIKWRDDL